ncbi:YciI family protein [Sinomonas sp. P10A9]|uniref:YciI family protein n=1 Tax=Sinomonas puerhi TaxID=3238584 RepID=A0AB39L0Z9_9MICC
MARFLITYHGYPYPDMDVLTAQRRDFRAWAQKALGQAMVDFGAPVYDAGQMSTKGPPLPPVEIDGYTIIEARSVSEVRALLEDHPFLELGGTIQINACFDV